MAIRADTLGEGLWPFLRSTALPVGGKVYISRNFDIQRIVSCGLIIHLTNLPKGWTPKMLEELETQILSGTPKYPRGSVLYSPEA